MLPVRRYMHRRCRLSRLIGLLSVMVIGYVTTLFREHNNLSEQQEKRWNNEGEINLYVPYVQTRHLLANGSLYPDGPFTDEQKKHGAIVLHFIGMAYMFIALAIVCDEFFIPALGVITEKLKLSDDVAGATFMAAGGSVPELCTSIIGLFISTSDVGIGTIVGSAVFNILFVIGMCAVFSKGVLELTWWPLFRDVFFYSLSIVVLLISFRDGKIEWYESLMSLIMYCFYVLFMKFNHTVESFVKGLLNRNRIKDDQGEKKVNGVNGHNGRTRSMPMLCAGPLYRHGALQLMIHTLDPLSDSNVEQKAEKMSAIAKSPVNSKPVSSNRINSTNSVNTSHTSLTYFVTTEQNQMCTENQVDQMTISTTTNSTTQLPNVDVNGAVNHGISETNFDNGFMNGNSTNADNPDRIQSENDLEEEEEPLDISWPKTARKRVTYLLLAPLVIPMWLTIPDVRRPERKKFFVLSFSVSLIFIACYSYLMVWWATEVGETFGIPEPVMGLTFIAAGTSIPDLITSVIVARKGLGDMAVSSSVGSNIFDITVGLPFPWLLYNIIYNSAAPVFSKNLFCSILLLFAMLIFVTIVIIVSKWRMTKVLGSCMFLMYCVFLTFALLFEYNKLQCPV
ncbi:sodium/potassium/calcium exchanger 2-like [Antedon mediterranea]|uniref:sodium/potassium/calcium exchanger 2-like n=1 Tax=Antedon mediterranea TaxID=105859 RepID=UPI003AF8AEA8